MAKTYRVKPGDNLRELADKLGVSIEELQSTNGIRNLTPGQTIRVPQQYQKHNAGFYQTGEGEQLTFSQNGETIRMGQNSTIEPSRPTNAFQQFMQAITGKTPSVPSQFNGTRGNVPNKVNGLASPTRYDGNGIGASGRAGAVSYQTGEGEYRTVDNNGQQIRMGPNSTFTPRNNSNNGFFESLQNLFAPQSGGNFAGTRGSVQPTNNKGIGGLASPTQYGGGGIQAGSNIGGVGPTANQMIGDFAQNAYYNLQHQGTLPYIPQVNVPVAAPYRYPTSTYRAPAQYPVSTYRAPQPQVGYVPPPMYAGPQRQGIGEVFNAVQNYVPPATTTQAAGQQGYRDGNGNPTNVAGNYGNYGNTGGLNSGQAKTAQEAYQQGNRGGTRWWIGRGRSHAAAPVVNPLDFQTQNRQQLAWRV